MKRPTYVFPNTARTLPDQRKKFTREHLESLTVAELEELISNPEEIEGSGVRGRVIKCDLVEFLLR